MEKKVKVILTVAGSLAAIGLGFGIYKKVKTRREEQAEGLDVSEESIITDAGEVISEAASSVANVFVAKCDREPKFPIKRGQESSAVKNLQIFANRFGGNPTKLKEDCDYGKLTDDALKSTLRLAGADYQGGISREVYNQVILESIKKGSLVKKSTTWWGTEL